VQSSSTYEVGKSNKNGARKKPRSLQRHGRERGCSNTPARSCRLSKTPWSRPSARPTFPYHLKCLKNEGPRPRLFASCELRGTRGERRGTRQDCFSRPSPSSLAPRSKSDFSTQAAREAPKHKLRDDEGNIKFPINDCADVADAWQLRGSSNIPKEKVEAYIRRVAAELGCDGPWTRR
jgi:hypothetical protein